MRRNLTVGLCVSLSLFAACCVWAGGLTVGENSTADIGGIAVGGKAGPDSVAILGTAPNLGATGIGGGKSYGAFDVAMGKDAVCGTQLGAANGSQDNLAIGRGATTGPGLFSATAFGPYSVARLNGTTNISGIQIVRKSDPVSDPGTLTRHGASVWTWASPEFDMTAAPHDAVYTLPAGSHAYVREVAVITDSVASLTVQPTIRVGWSGAPDALVPSTLATALGNPFACQVFAQSTRNGITSISVGTTSPAVAGAMKCRFLVTWTVIEDQ